MMYPKTNLTQAYRLLILEERHKQLSQLRSHTENMVFAVDKKRFNDQLINKGYKHKQVPHPCRRILYITVEHEVRTGSAKVFVGNKMRMSSLFCNHCNKPGHSIDKCWKIHGYLADHKGYRYKRIATIAHQQNEDSASTEESDCHAPIPTISVQQYNPLISS